MTGSRPEAAGVRIRAGHLHSGVSLASLEALPGEFHLPPSRHYPASFTCLPRGITRRVSPASPEALPGEFHLPPPRHHPPLSTLLPHGTYPTRPGTVPSRPLPLVKGSRARGAIRTARVTRVA